MAGQIFLSLLAVGDQKPPSQEDVRGLVTAMGTTALVSRSPNGDITIGFPADRFPTQDAARGQLEMALFVQYGEKWGERFQVVDS